MLLILPEVEGADTGCLGCLGLLEVGVDKLSPRAVGLAVGGGKSGMTDLDWFKAERGPFLFTLAGVVMLSGLGAGTEQGGPRTSVLAAMVGMGVLGEIGTEGATTKPSC